MVRTLEKTHQELTFQTLTVKPSKAPPANAVKTSDQVLALQQHVSSPSVTETVMQVIDFDVDTDSDADPTD